MLQRSRVTLYYSIALSLILIVSACRTSIEPAKQVDQKITTTIAGRIVDESGAPIQGVKVTAGTSSILTDKDGLFNLSNASVSSTRAVVFASKAGYFDVSRAAIPSSNGATYVEFGLIQRNLAGQVSASAGGAVNISSASIRLPAGGFVTSSGTPYNGTVSVYAKYLSPSDANFSHVFPGDMRAYRADSSLTELWSFGVIVADLEGSSGEKLELASNKSATLTAPIISADQSFAPSSIPMWHFDGATGIWNEEGTASKQGTSYVASVKHFSFWNYDMQDPYGTIHGRIVCGGLPIPGVKINLAAYVEGGLPNVITDGAGEFIVRVVANHPDLVILQVLSSENNGAFWTSSSLPINAAPNTTTELGDISLNSPCPTFLTGTIVGCDEKTLMAGMVVGSWTGGMSYVSTTDGKFKMIAPANTTINLSATATTGDLMQPRSFTTAGQGQNTDIGTIVACNNGPSDVLADITGTYDGRVLVFSPDGTTLAASLANNDLAFLDTKTWKETKHISQVFAGSYGNPIVRFSPDGSNIVVASYSQSIQCWSVQGTKLFTINGMSAAFTSDGQAVVVGDYQAANEYDLQGKLIKKLSVNGYYPVILGLTSNDMMAIESNDKTTYKPAIDLWDVASNASTKSYPISANAMDSISGMGTLFSYDRKLLSMTETNAIVFLDAVTGSQQGTLPTPYNAGFGIAPDNATILGQYRAGTNNTVALVNISDGTQKHIFDPPSSGGFTGGVAISPDGKQAVAAYPNDLRVWKVQ